MPSESKPTFVVIEGLDGTGTTTVAAGLAEALQTRDQRVHLTAEPTDGPFGRLLRRHVRREVTLDPPAAGLVFTADRADHVAGLIAPALARGDWVVCDRYLLSTLAYQGADGVDRDAIFAASSTFPVPDVTFVLDVPDDVRMRRLASREHVERYEAPELDERLRASYEASIAFLRSHEHLIDVVDASPPVSDVLETIVSRLDVAR